MKTKFVDYLNEIIARELGTNPMGENIYRWDWSNDLKWPAFATGRKVESKTPSGLVVMSNEYIQGQQTDKLNCWIVTKWFSPDHFPNWDTIFPGAPVPARGYRVPTDWYIPAGATPTEEGTIKMIYAVRSLLRTADQVNREAEDKLAATKVSNDKALDDQLEEAIPAFSNPTPGKRGGHVSMPSVTQVNGKTGSSNLIIH